jgi:hypothetical protein
VSGFSLHGSFPVSKIPPTINRGEIGAKPSLKPAAKVTKTPKAPSRTLPTELVNIPGKLAKTCSIVVKTLRGDWKIDRAPVVVTYGGGGAGYGDVGGLGSVKEK